MNKIEQVKKLSVATAFGKVKVRDLPDEGMKVGRFFGRAVGIKGGTSQYGEWECLTGKFRCLTEDGRTLESSQCFLPDVALNSVKVPLSMEGCSGVDFAIDIFATPDDKSSVGYVYTFQHVLPPSQDDPLEKMAAQINNLQLAAPTKAAGEEKPAENKGKK